MNPRVKVALQRAWNEPRSFFLWLSLLALLGLLGTGLVGSLSKEVTEDLELIAIGWCLLLALGLVAFVLSWVPPLHRALSWLLKRRFFILACGITLIVFLFVFENWRGRRAWKRFVAEAKAAGEDFSPAAVIPPSIPDAENFAMAPLLRPLSDYTRPGQLTDSVEWRDTNGLQRIEGINAIPDVKGLPPANSWRQGKFTDLAAWQAFYRQQTNFPSRSAAQSPGEDILFALGKFDSELAELRAAAARPGSRFALHYGDHVGMLLRHLTALKGLTHLPKLRALAELSLDQPDRALDDTLLALRMSESISEEPTLISQLVRITQLEIVIQPIWDGLARRQWNDAQLAALDTRLARVNLAASYRLAMRGERNLLAFAGMDEMKKNPKLLRAISDDGSVAPDGIGVLRMPDAFFDQSKIVMGRMYAELLKDASPETRRFTRTHAEEVERRVVELKRTAWRHPYSILAAMLMPALTKSVERFAGLQGTIDLARAAIALERHRLKHGAFPESLAALDASVAPAGGVPRDVLSGELPHYQRTADGRFKLYFNGWNETDDGGVTAWQDKQQTRVDFTKGDWVWPMPEQ